MYEAECAFRRLDGGALELVPEAEIDEVNGDFCKLRVKFAVNAIYPPEPDTGAEMDWDGDVAVIEMRTEEFRRWRRLRDEEFVTAKAYLLAHHGKALWQAGADYAEALHYREVA